MLQTYLRNSFKITQAIYIIKYNSNENFHTTLTSKVRSSPLSHYLFHFPPIATNVCKFRFISCLPTHKGTWYIPVVDSNGKLLLENSKFYSERWKILWVSYFYSIFSSSLSFCVVANEIRRDKKLKAQNKKIFVNCIEKNKKLWLWLLS